MVALKPPFQARNHLALATKIVGGQVERIPERYSELLRDLITCMLSSDPSKRPSVTELIKHPTVQLRLEERSIRDRYSLLKKKEL